MMDGKRLWAPDYSWLLIAVVFALLILALLEGK